VRILLALLFFSACVAPDGEVPDDDDTTDDDDIKEPDPTEDPWYCDVPSLDVVAENGGVRVTGPTVDLWAAVDEDRAVDLAELLEAALPAIEAWFGEEVPSDRLPLNVELHADEASMLAAIAAAGVEKPAGAGGFYHPSVQTSWLYRQPTRYYEQVLLLHEVVHQVHDLVRSSSHNMPGWWVEGVAEYLGRHDWDGECARVAQRPLGTLEDFDRQALEALEAGVSFSGALTGGGGRPGGYGLLRYLDRGFPGLMAELRISMDEGDGALDSEAAVEAIYGDVGDGWRDWLADHQQPMNPFYEEWFHRTPDSMIGRAGGMIHGRIKEAPTAFHVTVPGPDGGRAAGVLAAWDSNSDWVTVVAAEDGIWSFDATSSGAVWNWRADLPSTPGPHDVTAVAVEGGTELTWGDVTFVSPHDLTFAGGLAVSGGEAFFENIAWE
jgi:hypothetical protein